MASKRFQTGLILGLTVLAVALQFGRTFDDPLITLRYAHNVLAGNGPVFNPGQRVEGFTSPLHLVLAVVVRAIPGGANLFLLTIASAVFACLATHRALVLLRRIALPDWARLLAIVLVGSNWIIARMGSDALETTLSVWLVVWLLDLLVSKSAFTNPYKAATVGALAAAARPENALVIAAFAAVAWLCERHVARVRRLAWLIGPALMTILLTFGRLVYYGEPLANTYYAKKLPLLRGAHEGIQFLQSAAADQFGNVIGGPVALIIAAAAVALLALVAFEHRTRTGWGPMLGYGAALVGANLVFIMTSGGGIRSGGPRFLTVSIVPLVVISTMGLVALTRRHHTAQRSCWVLAGCLAALSLVPLFPIRPVTNLRHGISDTHLVANGGHRESPMWVSLSPLVACAPSGSTVAASELGLLGSSRLDLNFTDMRGLTNATIAHHVAPEDRHVWGVFDPDWYRATSVVGGEIVRTNPVLILTFDPLPKGMTTLYGHYDLVHTFNLGVYHIRSFARRDGPCDTRPQPPR